MRLKMISIFLVAIWCLTTPSFADDWREYRSANIHIYSNIPKAEVINLIKDVERAGAYLQEISGYESSPPPQPLTLYLYRSQAEFRDIIGNRQVLGVYKSTLKGGISATVGTKPVDPRKLGGRHVVLHELSHHFLAQLSELNFPIWYVEGFADVMSTLRFERKRTRMGETLIPRVAPLNDRKSWAQLSDILNAKDPDIGRFASWDGRDRFYAQSWLLAHMVLLNPNFSEKRDNFLKNISTGMSPDQAIETNFNMSAKKFESTYSNYWKGGRLPTTDLKAKKVPPLNIAVKTLNREQSDAIHWRAQLEFVESSEGLAEFINTTRQSLNLKDNPEVRILLADAFLISERPDKAGKQIDIVLKNSPNHIRARVLRERINIDIAIRRLEGLGPKGIAGYDFDKIKRNLLALLAEDAKNSHILYMIGLTYFIDPASGAEESLQYFERAQELLPQNNEVRLMMAKTLIRINQIDWACTKLNHVKSFAKIDKLRKAAAKEISKLQSPATICE